MTDLSKGIVSFDEIQITSNTTKQEVLNYLADAISPVSGKNIVYLLKLLTIENTKFMVIFNFNDNGNIKSLQLTPYIQYKSEKWDRTGRQQERRQFCDKWLFERFGVAHQITTSVTHYFFESVDVYSLSHFDLREGADAGYIVVEFNR